MNTHTYKYTKIRRGLCLITKSKSFLKDRYFIIKMQRYLKPYAFEISLGKTSICEEGLWTEIHLNGRQRSHYIYLKRKKDKPARHGTSWLKFWNITVDKGREIIRRNGIMNTVKYHREINKIKVKRYSEGWAIFQVFWQL